jgi:hypothetical protein
MSGAVPAFKSKINGGIGRLMHWWTKFDEICCLKIPQCRD